MTPKISAKFDQGKPLRGRQMQVGWVKIVDFWQITGSIPKMVKNRHSFYWSRMESCVRSSEWWHCRWPWVPSNHPIFCMVSVKDKVTDCVVWTAWCSYYNGEFLIVLLQRGGRAAELLGHSTIPGHVECGRRQPQSTRTYLLVIHTHTHGRLSGITQVSRYQKGKTNVDFTEARDSEWQCHWAICKSAPRSRQITTPTPYHSFFYQPDAFFPPNEQC